MVAAAGNDLDWTKPGAEWEITSKELGFGENSRFYEFPEMAHGWANRGDINDAKIRRDVDLVFNNVLDFI